MVSKPNPTADEEIRHRMYNSYQRQMPMWDYPGDFHVGRPLMDGGCYNCNAAFKLGSGHLMNYSYNAYDAPSQFFYVPYKMEWYGQHGFTNLKKKRGGARRKRQKKSRYSDYDNMKLREEADSDWYSIVKELVPLGFKIGDIIKIFIDKFQGKYGGEMINDLLNLNVKAFEKSAQELGEHQYR